MYMCVYVCICIRMREVVDVMNTLVHVYLYTHTHL